MHEQILTMLAGSHAQQPMRFNALLDISGLYPDTLNMVLDQMYAAHSINQATVTRSGIMQREVWPTGVVSNQIYLNSLRTPLPPLPRRNEIKPKLMEETMTQDMPQDLEIATLASTLEANVFLPPIQQLPKALTILKFIEVNPFCNSAQISHATGIESPRSYIKTHISRGAVIVAGENRNDMKMHLTQGQTAEGIYGNGYTQRQPAPSAALLAEVQAAHDCTEFSDSYQASGLPALILTAAEPVGRVGFQPHAEPCSVGNELPTLPLTLTDIDCPAFDMANYETPATINKRQDEQPADEAPSPKFDTDLGFYIATALKAKNNPFSQDDFAIDAVNTLFDLLPPQSEIVIRRADGELQIDIEADVFGKPVAKTVLINEVVETLNALHIVTVEMA